MSYEDHETLGLKFVDEFDFREPDYSFDLYRVMFDVNRKMYRVGEDSGCSCPSPFEDFNSDADWGEPLTAKAVVAAVRAKDVEASCLNEKLACADAVEAHAKEHGLW